MIYYIYIYICYYYARLEPVLGGGSNDNSSIRDGQTYPKRFLPELNKTQ